MGFGQSEALAIALFVPDSAMKVMAGKLEIPGIEEREPAGLDFLPPPWWEVSHTVKLGLASSMGMLAGR